MHRAVSSQVLKTSSSSRVGDCTASGVNMLYYLTIFMGAKIFCHIQSEIFLFLFSPVLPPCTIMKNLILSPRWPSHQHRELLLSAPAAICSPGWWCLGLSTSTHMASVLALIILVTLPWTCTPADQCLSCLEVGGWQGMVGSKMDAVVRIWSNKCWVEGIVTSLALLAVLLVKQPRILLALFPAQVQC